MSDLCVTAAPRPSEVGSARPRAAGRRTRAASLNGAALLLDYAAKLGAGLVVTPFLVAGLGSSLFGVWQVLSRVVGYLNAADGRPGQALQWLVAQQQSSPEALPKQKAIGSALLVWLQFLPLVAAAGAVVMWLAPSVLDVPAELVPAVRAAAGILLLNAVLGGVLQLPEAVLRGMNLGYRRMGIAAAFNLVAAALSVGAVGLGLGLPGLAGAQVAAALATALLFWHITRRSVPWFRAAAPSRQELREFRGLSFSYFGGSLLGRALHATDVVVLGAACSAGLVTEYTLNGYAALTVAGGIALLLGALSPGLAGIVGEGDLARARRVRGDLMLGVWLLATVAGATILAANRSFVTLWVGGAHYAGLWANVLIVLVMVQWIFIRTDGYVIDLTLKLREKLRAAAVAAVASALLAFLLAKSWGIPGLCVGLLLGRGLLSAAYPAIARNLLGGDATRLGWRPALLTVVLFAAAGAIGDRMSTPSWLAWAGYTAALTLGASAAALFLGLSPGERETLLGRVRAALRRTSPLDDGCPAPSGRERTEP
jgi:O-antigen/teichoic acid export membrane protein